MIELIFVIVILGILASVAIPKLAATRNDAIMVRVSSDIMTGASEIASFAISKGFVESNLSKMSNAIKDFERDKTASVDNNKTAIIKFGNIVDCVTIKVFSGTNDENLTISFGNPNGDQDCIDLQSLIDARQYPMKLRGQTVVY